jgi:hypothetical protein
MGAAGRNGTFENEPLTKKAHWESVYEAKPADAVSWNAPHLRESLRYVNQAAAHKRVAINSRLQVTTSGTTVPCTIS